MLRKEKILVCYNEPVVYYDNYTGKNDDGNFIDLSESEFFTHLNSIEQILKNNFENVALLALKKDFNENISNIEQFDPDIIYNFVESIEGKAEFEVFVAGLFDILDIQYTGNTGLTLANCLNKNRAKQILSSYSIPTPEYKIISSYEEINDINLNFPLILKLNNEDASIGISEESVVRDKESLIKRLCFLFGNYKQSIIIEEYIEGREFNVSILNDEVLPISEIDFTGLPDTLPRIVTYEAKWSEDSIYYSHTTPVCPANIGNELKTILENIALKAYYALECRDYARVDIRLNSSNNPYVIEVNPNPDISEESGFVRAAEAAGIGYEELIVRLANLAIERKEYYDSEIEETRSTEAERNN